MMFPAMNPGNPVKKTDMHRSSNRQGNLDSNSAYNILRPMSIAGIARTGIQLTVFGGG